MAIARSYQQFSEVLLSQEAFARSRHQFAEVLESSDARAVSYQQFVEVLLEKSNTNAVNYHQFAEVLVDGGTVAPFAISFHQFAELLIEYDPLIDLSDNAYATDGFYADQEGTITVNDAGTTAIFNSYGTIDAGETPDRLTISDLAIASNSFVTENPTLIVISDLAIATNSFSIRSQLHITSTAIASNKAGTVLDGNPGILAENRDPW